MADTVERLVNLAMLLASSRTPVTAAQVCAQVAGYPPDQDEAAFLRMFERDKGDLRAAGLVICVDRSGESEAYRLDAAATYAVDLELSAEESMLVRAAGAAMLADPSFPFPEELRLAFSKLTVLADGAPVPVVGSAPVASLTADEAPEAQGDRVAELLRAAGARKRVTFGYAGGSTPTASREVEPYGLFARDGRWYLVGRDTSAEDMRVFAVARMSDLAANPLRPKSSDFERPSGFDVRVWMLLPFQFGPQRCEALLRFTGPAAPRADALSAGQGRLEARPDGSFVWTVPVADLNSLARWTVSNGPGIEVTAPDAARHALTEGLLEVVSAHGD